MAGFDNPGLYYYDRFNENEGLLNELDGQSLDLTLKAAHRRFKDFLRTFHRGGFTHVYREQLARRCNLGEYWLQIDAADLRDFDEELADRLRQKPAQFWPVFEEAAREVADEITRPRADDEQDIPDVQIMLNSDRIPQNIRSLKSSQVSHLVTISGIIIGASQVRSKATHITIQCRSCKQMKSKIALKAGLDGYALPRRCTSDQSSLAQKCPVDPYFIVPDKCQCVDFQLLKLQEAPEDVPHGEMPRHLQLYAERYLTDRVTPGNKVTITGIYSIKLAFRSGKSAGNDRPNSGIRMPYLRVLGINVETSGLGRTAQCAISLEEEEYFRNLARDPEIYEKVAKSIAPSIYGSEDIKKSIVCLLFAGSRKRLPDGLKRRGDINVLLLGDPGTAKSQLLKFVEKVSPIGVYTSGKGSSAAGLTASVLRDPSTRGFILEGGAMVLADGGVVCIDEFDKMREDDRVAIHEAMEQQTISIAKAGITTTLNSRCAVFAAANSVFGRWDDTKGQENIDFMPTILSRFDMIFIVKDEHDEKRDIILAKHVIGVHAADDATDRSQQHQDGVAMDQGANGELPLHVLKKYIAFCRQQCGPRLSDQAARKLCSYYVRMRNPQQAHQQATPAHGRKSAIPITVRQLEALVRISEALAKIELSPFAVERHVDEACRLFKVSTLQAATQGHLSGVEGFTTTEEFEVLNRIEKQLKSRLAVGTQVSEHVVVQDFVRQRYDEHVVKKILQSLLRRGEIQYRMQRKMVYRVK